MTLSDKYPFHTSAYYIKGFFGEYRFLSNFHECLIKVKSAHTGEELSFPSTENFFQYSKLVAFRANKKCELPEDFITVSEEDLNELKVCSPSDSKKISWKYALNTHQQAIWNVNRVKMMRMALKFKFDQHKDLRDKLLNTDGKYLEESNNWSDQFWGVHYTKNEAAWNRVGGHNVLGHLLMLLRSEYSIYGL